MPVAVEYATKSKTGEQVKASMVEKIRRVQVCRKCCHDAKSNNLTLSSSEDYCNAYCDVCWTTAKVCTACERMGQTSHIPALRACSQCLNGRIKCQNVAVAVITTDCEECNKQALSQLHDDAAEQNLPSDLYLLSAMPDVVHLGKSLKCSWSNWVLWFNGTRSTLAMLYNLRREGEPELRTKLKKLLTEESVRNKDRMAVDPILLLTKPELLEVLSSAERVVYTIVPEKYRMWKSNRPGMYPHPLSVACGPFGKLLVLDFEPLTNTSKLLLVRLHSPADVNVLVEGLENAKSVAYTGGVAYCTQANGTIRYVPIDKEVRLRIGTLKTKVDLQTKLQEFHLSTEGTVKQLRERLASHLHEVEISYKGKTNIIAGVKFDKPTAICSLSEDILLVADDGHGCFWEVVLSFDGVSIQGTGVEFSPYPHATMSVTSLAYSKEKSCVLFTANGRLGGIFHLNLSSHQVSTVLRNLEPDTPERDIACVAVDSEGTIYFTDRKNRQIWKCDGTDGSNLSVHAGKGQQGTADGSAMFAEFSQPYGICCEGRTQYVTDSATGCVKLVTPLDGTVEFLTHLGDLFRNFGIHLRGQTGMDSTLVDAQTCLQGVTRFLKRCV